MKKIYLGFLLIVVMCITGCANNTADKVSDEITEIMEITEKGSGAPAEENKLSEEKAGIDEFDDEAEFMDLRLGDTVNVATAGLEETWKYKFTLNSVEYAEGEINGYDGEGDDFIILDISVKGAGPDVSYGLILTELYLGGNIQVSPERQADYGLNTFANPDETLSDGEEVRGRIAIMYDKGDIEVERRAMATTKFLYTVGVDEIKDYTPGEQ